MKPIVRILLMFLWIGVVFGAEQVVTINSVAPSNPIEPGKTSVLTIELSIAEPYHINSDKPLEDYLIPTVLELEPQPSLTFGKISFPPAPVKRLPFSESPMAVYEKTLRITAEVTAGPNLDAKQISLKGKLKYQACNNQYCLPPAALSFDMPVGAERASQAASSPNAAPSRNTAKETSGLAGSSSPGSPDFTDKGLLAIFVLVFLGGLALNLTPCVYPMIPITITYFGGQSSGSKRSLLAHAWLYVVGMAITYSVLGVVAAMTGGLFGAAQQYPPVLIGIALVMVLLALSMFDVYELRMPQFLNRLAGSSQTGFLGTLLMGMTVGIVAAPCIGPFVLGLLTYVGNRGNPMLGFSLFFTLALGLGVPFLVLAMFSGSIQRLPRSGAWMVWVRKVFGFVLLGMAVFFLKPLFPTVLAYFLTLGLVLLLAGIYLAWIDTVPGSGKGFAFGRNVIGIIFFAAALYAVLTGFESNRETVRGSAARANPAVSVQWVPYSQSIMDRAVQDRKPVFLDFYADWCAPCKELDEQTYSTAEVAAMSKKFIMVKVDLTAANDPEAEMLRAKYKVRGVPTLVFLRPDGQEISGLRGTGFEPKEVFMRKMTNALELSGASVKDSM